MYFLPPELIFFAKVLESISISRFSVFCRSVDMSSGFVHEIGHMDVFHSPLLSVTQIWQSLVAAACIALRIFPQYIRRLVAPYPIFGA